MLAEARAGISAGSKSSTGVGIIGWLSRLSPSSPVWEERRHMVSSLLCLVEEQDPRPLGTWIEAPVPALCSALLL